MASERFWNVFFTGIFLLILAVMYFYLLITNTTIPLMFNYFELAFMTLAIFRLTRLFVYDKILKFFRDWFATAGWQGTVKDLLACPWCVSMWFAPFIVFIYIIFPQAMFFYIILGIAGVAAVVQIFINAIGHWGEKQTR